MVYVKNIKFVFFNLVMLVVISQHLYAGNQLNVKAAVSPGVGTVGDMLEYRVNIAGKDTGKFEVFLPKDDIKYQPEKSDKTEQEKDPDLAARKQSVPLYLIHKKTKDDRSEGDITDLTVILTISYFKPGTYVLPEIDIIGPDNIKIGYKVPQVEIKESNPSGKPEEIEPPLDLKGNYYRLIFLILGVAVVTLLAVFLFKRIRKVIHDRKAVIKKVPPLEIFMRAIEKFNGKKLIDKDKIEDYVFGISKIFRDFLSGLLHIDAAEMTSEEIHRALKAVLPKQIHELYRTDLDSMFQLWDLSRYAEFLPSKIILLQNLEQTIKTAQQLNTDIAKEQEDAASGV